MGRSVGLAVRAAGLLLTAAAVGLIPVGLGVCLLWPASRLAPAQTSATGTEEICGTANLRAGNRSVHVGFTGARLYRFSGGLSQVSEDPLFRDVQLDLRAGTWYSVAGLVSGGLSLLLGAFSMALPFWERLWPWHTALQASSIAARALLVALCFGGYLKGFSDMVGADFGRDKVYTWPALKALLAQRGLALDDADQVGLYVRSWLIFSWLIHAALVLTLCELAIFCRCCECCREVPAPEAEGRSRQSTLASPALPTAPSASATWVPLCEPGAPSPDKAATGSAPRPKKEKKARSGPYSGYYECPSRLLNQPATEPTAPSDPDDASGTKDEPPKGRPAKAHLAKPSHNTSTSSSTYTDWPSPTD